MPLFTWRWSCGESHRHRISILGSSPTRLQCKQTEIKPSPTHSRTVRGQAPSRAVSGCACLHGLCQQSTISIRLFFWGVALARPRTSYCVYFGGAAPMLTICSGTRLTQEEEEEQAHQNQQGPAEEKKAAANHEKTPEKGADPDPPGHSITIRTIRA